MKLISRPKMVVYTNMEVGVLEISYASVCRPACERNAIIFFNLPAHKFNAEHNEEEGGLSDVRRPQRKLFFLSFLRSPRLLQFNTRDATETRAATQREIFAALFHFS